MKYRWQEPLKCLIKALTSKMIYSIGNCCQTPTTFKRGWFVLKVQRKNTLLLWLFQSLCSKAMTLTVDVISHHYTHCLYFNPLCMSAAKICFSEHFSLELVQILVSHLYRNWQNGDRELQCAWVKKKHLCKLQIIPVGLTSAMTRLETFGGRRWEEDGDMW